MNARAILRLMSLREILYYGEIAQRLSLPIDEVMRAAHEIEAAGLARVRTTPVHAERLWQQFTAKQRSA